MAREFGIKNAAEILEGIRSALTGWEGCAARYAVPEETVSRVRQELDERAAGLGLG